MEKSKKSLVYLLIFTMLAWSVVLPASNIVNAEEMSRKALVNSDSLINQVEPEVLPTYISEEPVVSGNTGGDLQPVNCFPNFVDVVGQKNNPNFVDMSDLAAFSDHYGTTASSTNWNPVYDANGDGVVNEYEKELFASYYNQPFTCGITPFVLSAIVVADKIVCENEEDLPNWGLGGSDITANTSQDFLDGHQNCHLKEGWNFQWANGTESTPDDNYGEYDSDSGWHTFGPTNGNGRAVALLTDDVDFTNALHLREVWQEGYQTFEGADNSSDISAEIYCHTDVLNYDNYDYISGAQSARIYYCVAFNVLTSKNVDRPVSEEETNDVPGCFPNFVEENNPNFVDLSDLANFDNSNTKACFERYYQHPFTCNVTTLPGNCGDIGMCGDGSEYDINKDYINIGDPVSETSHNLTGWSVENLMFNGSNYGGGDDGTYRMVLEPDQCNDNSKFASFTLNTGDEEANSLVIRHLDGSSNNDGFKVYVNGVLVGDYTDLGDGDEGWLTTRFDLANLPVKTGELTVQIELTDTIWPYCATYGQLAISWVALDTCSIAPYCGNYIREGSEQCDGQDNMADGYHCTAGCIVEADQIPVSGGSGGSIAPNISSIYTAPQCTNTVISWLTSSSVPTWIVYGTKSGVYTNEYKDNLNATGHSITLIDLKPATTYYFQIKMEKLGGTVVTSEERTFTTNTNCGQVLGQKIKECTWNWRVDGSTGPDSDVVGVTQFSDGTLLRGCSSPAIYRIENQKAVHLRTLKELSKYIGQRIYNVLDSTLNLFM